MLFNFNCISIYYYIIVNNIIPFYERLYILISHYVSFNVCMYIDINIIG